MPEVPSPVIYQLQASLRGILPMIWRRLLVTGDLTLHRLHRVGPGGQGCRRDSRGGPPAGSRAAVPTRAARWRTSACPISFATSRGLNQAGRCSPRVQQEPCGCWASQLNCRCFMPRCTRMLVTIEVACSRARASRSRRYCRPPVLRQMVRSTSWEWKCRVRGSSLTPRLRMSFSVEATQIRMSASQIVATPKPKQVLR